MNHCNDGNGAGTTIISANATARPLCLHKGASSLGSSASSEGFKHYRAGWWADGDGWWTKDGSFTILPSRHQEINQKANITFFSIDNRQSMPMRIDQLKLKVWIDSEEALVLFRRPSSTEVNSSCNNKPPLRGTSSFVVRSLNLNCSRSLVHLT